MGRIFLLSLAICSFAASQWNQQSFPTTEYLWKARLATEQTGWIAGHDYIYKTTNGGSSWIVQDTTGGACDAMSVIDAQTMLYQKWNGVSTRGIRRTSDGGVTWNTVDTLQHYYADMCFPTAAIGFTSGYDVSKKPVVMKTTDGGVHWVVASKDFPKPKFELTGISFPDTSNGWAISYDGFVYRTTDGGSTWAYQDSLEMAPYRDIEFANKDTGYAVGGMSGDMVIATTYNGGATWNKYKTGGGSLREVMLHASGKAWSVGLQGSVYVKLSGSSSWTAQMNDGAQNFESITIANDMVGMVVGGGGALFKTTNGGVMAVQGSDKVPAMFLLDQNHPNPFNPATTLSFSLPRSGFVTLKVYDLLGKEIATVVNGDLSAGEHRYPFNGALLVSGLYFYRLQTDNFTAVKKMLLLK